MKISWLNLVILFHITDLAGQMRQKLNGDLLCSFYYFK